MAKVKDEPNAHFSVTLPQRVTDRLTALAKKRGSARADVVREAVFHYFECQVDRLERAS